MAEKDDILIVGITRDRLQQWRSMLDDSIRTHREQIKRNRNYISDLQLGVKNLEEELAAQEKEIARIDEALSGPPENKT